MLRASRSEIRERRRAAGEKRAKGKRPLTLLRAGVGEDARRSIDTVLRRYCCGWGGGFAGACWSAGRAATCGIFGICVTWPRSASAIWMPA